VADHPGDAAVLLAAGALWSMRHEYTEKATARLAWAVLALHPVAAWVLRQIDRQRELACDD